MRWFNGLVVGTIVLAVFCFVAACTPAHQPIVDATCHGARALCHAVDATCAVVSSGGESP